MNEASLEKSVEKLYPYVVPTSFMDGTEPGMWASWPVSDDVRVALVFDCTGLVHNARPEDLNELGLDEGAAFDRAAENLAKALWAEEFQIGHAELGDGVEIGCVQGGWMAPAGGLVIRNFYDYMRSLFGAEQFVAIALNQELLIAFPPDDATLASAALTGLVEDRFLNHRKPLSRSWLLLDGEWPSAFPGRNAF